jgi:hypothetical protein
MQILKFKEKWVEGRLNLFFSNECRYAIKQTGSKSSAKSFTFYSSACMKVSLCDTLLRYEFTHFLLGLVYMQLMLPHMSYVMYAAEYKQMIMTFLWDGGSVPSHYHYFSGMALHYKPVRITGFLDCVHRPEF